MNNQKWLKGAIILWLSFFISILLVKPIGVSTQFSVLSGIVHSAIDQDVIQKDSERESGYRSSNEYYDKSDGKLAKAIKNPINYDFIFVLAIPLGSLIGYLTRSKKDDDELDLEDNVAESKDACKVGTNKSFIKKYLPNFIGGFLLLYGARLADGCTSGHMMSGMMQSSLSGYVFAGVVFAVAIPTAILIKKFKY